MYIHYPWVCEYLPQAPSLQEAARLLNETGLETDVSGEGLEIEYTVNRPDAMNHFGIARELAVKSGLPLVEPEYFSAAIPPLTDWSIQSNEPEHCNRYMGLYVENVKATPSPQWLKDRLEAIDQTCHNFLVDLTNFLLWEFGHPSHAFDADKIKGKQILVRYAREDENLRTLDGRDHKAGGLLVIADAQRPIAFGGVMGGENTEVDEHTTNLLLELGCFKASTVRQTGRRCNIESDARHRFERGIDREKMARVIGRFIWLLSREQPEARVVGLIDMDLAPFERVKLNLRRQRLDALLGVSLEEELVTDLLTRMDTRPEKTPEGWLVAIPGYKVDVTREADVIEEIIRFAGLDRLKSTLPAIGGSNFQYNNLYMGEDSIRELLRGSGWQETCTYGFLEEENLRMFETQQEPVRLRNPMSQAQAVMRTHILPNMLNSVRHNTSRGIVEQTLFEIGHTFRAVGDEPHHLGMVLVQGRERDSWWSVPAVHPFYQLKGALELLIHTLGWKQLKFDEAVPTWLTPGQALGIHLDGKPIGAFGMLASPQAKHWDLDLPVAVLELDLSFLQQNQPARPQVDELSQFPAMKLDLAFVLDKQHSYQDIQQHLEGLGLPDLEQMSLFDVYEGKAIGPEKRSLGFRFRFRAENRTLTSEEIGKTMDRITHSMMSHFGAVIRT